MRICGLGEFARYESPYYYYYYYYYIPQTLQGHAISQLNFRKIQRGRIALNW